MAITRLQREFIEHLMLKEQGSALSDAEWGRVVGVDPEVLKGWKKTKEFTTALDRERTRWTSLSPMERRSHLWAIEEAVKNYKTAQSSRSDAERRHWWKIVADLTKPKEDECNTLDYSSYPDEELWRLIEERGFESDAARIESELKGVPRGDTVCGTARRKPRGPRRVAGVPDGLPSTDGDDTDAA
jgi:hypothetical protein